ncbi:MAG: aminotransferase class IV [Deltaproteobacteria bacterium]|nr:aminotransferase class IV [Deltaproteobacteria bacterium]
MRVAVIDGRCMPGDEAKLSVFDRGFLFGDSAFETLRTYRREPFELDAHLERMGRSLEALAFPIAVPADALREDLHVALSTVDHGESWIRLYLSRGEGPPGLDPADAKEPSRVVLVDALRTPSVESYLRGVRVRCIETVRAADALASAKLTNYVASMLATREARRHGDDEALIVDRSGRVIEGATQNVFVVRPGGVLTTPPVDVGVLDGITRRIVLELARESRLRVELTAHTPAELCDAEEVFLTSSLRELVAVSHVDGVPLRSSPGPLTRTLHDAFRRRVGIPPVPYS